MRIVQFVLSLVLTVAMPLHAEPRIWKNEWPKTDFSETSVENWVEILSGGPPKDGIPALSDPAFVPAAEEARIAGNEPVMVVKIKQAKARAYPIRYLTWHEIVNDEVAGVPVAVTFCPLCNSAMVFDRRTRHGVLSFGVPGR